ncbi:MAG: hypothetical protein IID32_03915 [Planctomycetes bacterium]|nr:hypothetical protein [Planctomycetota bacterium]
MLRNTRLQGTNEMSPSDDRQLFILGAGGHGAELVSYLNDSGMETQGVCLAGFIDEQSSADTLCGVEIIGDFEALRARLEQQPKTAGYYITAAGNNVVRAHLVARVEALEIAALEPWSLVHPSVQIGQAVSIGVGTCLAPGVIVTTRVAIGRHCILNVKASVSHD